MGENSAKRQGVVLRFDENSYTVLERSKNDTDIRISGTKSVEIIGVDGIFKSQVNRGDILILPLTIHTTALMSIYVVTDASSLSTMESFVANCVLIGLEKPYIASNISYSEIHNEVTRWYDRDVKLLGLLRQHVVEDTLVADKGVISRITDWVLGK